MLVRQGVALGGSGSTYMYAYVDASYKENMTKEECYNFVSKGKSSVTIMVPQIAITENFISLNNSWLKEHTLSCTKAVSKLTFQVIPKIIRITACPFKS